MCGIAATEIIKIYFILMDFYQHMKISSCDVIFVCFMMCIVVTIRMHNVIIPFHTWRGTDGVFHQNQCSRNLCVKNKSGHEVLVHAYG